MIAHCTHANTSAYKQVTSLRNQLVSDLGIKKTKKHMTKANDQAPQIPHQENPLYPGFKVYTS